MFEIDTRVAVGETNFEMIEKYLLKLDPSKRSRPDKVHPIFLTRCNYHILFTLHILFPNFLPHIGKMCMTIYFTSYYKFF